MSQDRMTGEHLVYAMHSLPISLYYSDTLMSSLPVVPRELMSIWDCATPSAVNGYTLCILNCKASAGGVAKFGDDSP